MGGDDIFSVTGKVTWAPWRLGLGRWRVRPATAALQVSYTFGRQYYLFLPDRYPKGYHDFATAVRSGIAFGGSAATSVGRGRGRRDVALYYELVALDAFLLAWAQNPSALGPTRVFSLALGVRVAL